MGLFGNNSRKNQNNRFSTINSKYQPKTEEEYFLIDCFDLIKTCSEMTLMEDSIIPITTEKKLSHWEKKLGKKPEDVREIYFAQINPKGVKLGEIELPTKNVTAIGTIDKCKMFIYSTHPEKIEIIEVDEYLYDHIEDYYYRSNCIIRDGFNSDFEEIRIKNTIISDYTGITQNGTAIIHPYQKTFPLVCNWIKVADIIGKKRKACEERNTKPDLEVFTK